MPNQPQPTDYLRDDERTLRDGPGNCDCRYDFLCDRIAETRRQLSELRAVLVEHGVVAKLKGMATAFAIIDEDAGKFDEAADALRAALKET